MVGSTFKKLSDLNRNQISAKKSKNSAYEEWQNQETKCQVAKN